MTVSTRFLCNNNDKHVHDVSGRIAMKLSPMFPSGNGTKKEVRGVGNTFAFHHIYFKCSIYKCFNWSKFLTILIIIINLKSRVQNK